MKKISIILACICAVSFGFAQSAWDGHSVSTPSVDRNDYLITSAEELAWVAQEWKNNANTFRGKTLVFKADIDLGNHEWTPIGSQESPFQAAITGNRHIVKNLKVSAASNDYVGLFGYMFNNDPANLLKITGLTIRNANVSGHDYVGVFCGYAKNLNFSQCTVDSSTVSGNTSVGGFAGYFRNSAAAESYTKSMTLTVAMDGGLFIGFNDSADRSNVQISDCYAKGVITCSTYGGGFVGHNGYKSTVKNCYTIVRYTGQGTKLGVFCGRNDTLGLLENCAYNNNLNGNLAQGAIFEDHNHLDQETYLLGYPRASFSTQTFFGDFVNSMNHNTDKWRFDFNPYSINDKDPIHTWEQLLHTSVPNTADIQTSIYPNPVTNTLYIKVNQNETIEQVEVMNLLGAVIATEQSTEQIDMSSFKTGIYLIRIHTNSGTVTQKVVKR